MGSKQRPGPLYIDCFHTNTTITKNACVSCFLFSFLLNFIFVFSVLRIKSSAEAESELLIRPLPLLRAMGSQAYVPPPPALIQHFKLAQLTASHCVSTLFTSSLRMTLFTLALHHGMFPTSIDVAQELIVLRLTMAKCAFPMPLCDNKEANEVPRTNKNHTCYAA